jgi:LacI family transcriptional regulator
VKPIPPQVSARPFAASSKVACPGVILPPPVCESHVILTELKKGGIPTVAVATGRFRPDASCVRIDDFKAAYEMTRYLITLVVRQSTAPPVAT